MPIKPENRARYPFDWPAIVAEVRERSGNRCEGSPRFPDCRLPNGAVGYREGDHWVQLGESIDEAGLAVEAAEEDGHKVIRIVLTVGHLDHTPENCDRANLRHWCQRCHLVYDLTHHKTNAYMTRRAARNNLELPL